MLLVLAALGVGGALSCGSASPTTTTGADASAEAGAGSGGATAGTGGATGSGGATAGTGGATGSGGATAGTGGATGSGGHESAGTGGASGVGGAPASGGSPGGGGTGTGGAAAAGGTSAGGHPAGGTGGHGGATPSGGAGGGAGGSGPVMVSPGLCAGAQVTAKLVAAKAPLTLAATLTSSNPDDYGHISLAPESRPDTVLAALASSEHLFVVSPGGVSQQAPGVCGRIVRLRVDGNDVPQLFAETRPVPDRQAGDVFYALWTPAQPAWSAELFSQATSFPGPYNDYLSGDLAQDFLQGGSAAARVLASNGGEVSLFDRAAPGVWTATNNIVDNPTYVAAAIDSRGRSRVVYTDFRNVYGFLRYSEWIDGKVLTEFRKEEKSYQFAVAAGPSGTLGLARMNDAGIVVTSSDGTTVSSDYPIAGTAPYPSGADPCYASLTECKPVTCITDGVLPQTVALASAPDGAFWVAYRLLHDESEFAASGINPHYCWTFSKRTTVEKVVLVRVAPDGSVAPSVRWTGTSSTYSVAPVDLAIRGSRLYLGYAEQDVANVLIFDLGAL